MPLTIKDIEEFEDSFEELYGGKQEHVGDGQRYCFDLLGDGRSWYIVITPSSLEITVPEENKPLMKETRLVVGMLERAVTMMMNDHQFTKAMEEEPDDE